MEARGLKMVIAGRFGAIVQYCASVLFVTLAGSSFAAQPARTQSQTGTASAVSAEEILRRADAVRFPQE